ncbi:MAG: hypothetical protein E7294_10865 [Lachnospiraceae bacterium]|nr:hypothetical protein [Lachnospiraceae bacterium]
MHKNRIPWNNKTPFSRFTALLLCLSMTVNLLTGCGQKSPQDSQKNSLGMEKAVGTEMAEEKNETERLAERESESRISRLSNTGGAAGTMDNGVGKNVEEAAEKLGTALAVYNYLKNNIDYEYYHGSRKKAEETFSSEGGNDADQALLLVTMLHKLGHEAVYVRGNIELTAEQAVSLTGADDAEQAADMLASEGTPVEAVYDETERIVSIRMEHIWVRAAIPYTDYRGAGSAGGDTVWLDLDTGIWPVEEGVELTYLPSSLQYTVEKEIETFTQMPDPEENGEDPQTPGQEPGGEDPQTPGQEPGGEDPQTPGQEPGGEDPQTPGQEPGGEDPQTPGQGTGEENPQSPGQEENGERQLEVFLSAVRADIGEKVQIRILSPKDVKEENIRIYRGDILLCEGSREVDFTSLRTGKTVIRAEAVNEKGEILSAEAECTFYDRTDKNPPTVSLTSPQNESVLKGPAKVMGSAYDEEGLLSWKLEYRMDGQKEYTLLKEGSADVKDGELGELDTTLLLNGKYHVRLIAEDLGGNRIFMENTYIVEGGQKAGAMNIGFTDMETKFKGTKVTVNRIYDSREKTGGDSGIGWSIGLGGMRLSESHVLSEGYRMVRTGSLLATGYEMQETMSHDVVITYGDGTSDRFELTFSPQRKALVPITEVELGYRCVTNRKVKLEILGDTSAKVNGNGLFFYEEEMYDDLNYKLTTEEGTQIYLNRKKGVYKITDGAGNVITVDKNGYRSQDGTGIVFTRDEAGRITKLTDPDGKEICYAYDERDDLVSVTDRAGRTVSYAYDDDHNLLSITDPMGIAVERNEYDEDGRLSATIDAQGNRTEYAYDIEGRTETVRDKRGNTTVYTYDENGNILQTMDPYGNKTTNTYDENNNLLTTTDALGNTTSYTYDGSGNVTQVTAPDGTKAESTYTQENLVSSIKMMDKTVLAMKYDDKGRIASMEDANGNETAYSYTADGNLAGLTDAIGEYQRITYDEKGNVASTTNGAGESATYAYDADGNVISTTVSREENGQTKSFTSYYSYDEAGNITQSTDTAGNVTRYEYDLNGNQTALVDAKERRITYEYDTLGNLTRTTYPDGTYEEFTYDANGNSISARDRNGLTVSMTYDKLDRLTQKKYPDGTKETYAYDAVGNVTETVNTSGAKTTYAYDSRNRNISITDALGNTTGFEYDETSRLTKRIDAEGNETSYEYDANGNITKTTDACGNSVTAEYDARNRRIRQKDQNGNKTEYEYDGADRLIKVTDAYGNSYSYTYDANGNLVSVTDANDHVTRYAYDELGRAEKITNALGKSMEYTYDETGNVTQYRDYAGNVTCYEYDGMDRLVKKTVGKDTQEEAVTEYSFDETGMLVQVTDKSGTATYQYDDYDRLVKQTDANGNTLTYTYDKAGRLQSFDNGFGKTAYEYDTLDRVTRVIDRNGKATLYEYDALGNRSAVRYPNGTIVTYAYDPCQRLKEECITDANGVLLAKYSYGVGKAGERTSVTETETDPKTGNSTETEIRYEYDKLNRLTGETIQKNGDKLTYEYEYDAVSNRTGKKITVKGELETFADLEQEEVELSEGTTAYTYNALNQLIKEETPDGARTYTYDDNGNLVKLTGERSIDYRYDKENRLTRATIRKGNSVTVESYTYDHAGNRLSKTVNESNTTLYVNDTAAGLTQVVAETDKDGNETAYYTRGDELLSMERDGGVCYYLYDGHGDVRMLVDEAGTVTDRYRYDAYGNLLEKEGDTKNDFLYTGEQYNANTGLYYLRARYMDPSTGTFISMDSYPGSLADPVSLHKYLYANADPVKYSDPSGYMSFPQLSAGMTINGILSASWRYIVGNVIAGAVIGATCGAIDSILGGNDFSQVVKDAFAGFGVGALCGCVISALACYAVIAPICMAALEVFRGIILVSSGVSVYISAKEGNVSQAIFRGILGIIAYEGTGKLIDDVNFRISGSGYYQDSNGRWHRPNGQFASNAEMGIETSEKTSTGTHGNSLSDSRTNYGYALVDQDTNEILKFGETLYPDSRYSKKFLNESNAKMIIMEEGTKIDIHLWQHDMNEYYFGKYDEYPPLNSKGW